MKFLLKIEFKSRDDLKNEIYLHKAIVFLLEPFDYANHQKFRSFNSNAQPEILTFNGL